MEHKRSIRFQNKSAGNRKATLRLWVNVDKIKSLKSCHNRIQTEAGGQGFDHRAVLSKNVATSIRNDSQQQQQRRHIRQTLVSFRPQGSLSRWCAASGAEAWPTTFRTTTGETTASKFCVDCVTGVTPLTCCWCDGTHPRRCCVTTLACERRCCCCRCCAVTSRPLARSSTSQFLASHTVVKSHNKL